MSLTRLISPRCARLTAVGALALLLGVSAPAAEAALVGTGEDPAGDATSPAPGHDLTAVGLGYDRGTGLLKAAIQLRGAPGDAPAFLTLLGAVGTASGCDGAPAAGFGSLTDEFGATWLRFATPTEVTARGDADKIGYDGWVQEFEATETQLTGLRPDCVVATLTQPGDPSIVYDTIGPVPLVAYPSLAMRLGGLPEKVRTGRSYRLKVTLSNPGDASTGPIRVRLGRVRGMTPTPRRLTVRSIAAGRRATATMKVRFSPRVDITPELSVRASAGKLKATGTVRVFVRKPDRTPPSSGGGGEGGHRPSRVCTRWFPDFTGETGGSLGLIAC